MQRRPLLALAVLFLSLTSGTAAGQRVAPSPQSVEVDRRGTAFHEAASHLPEEEGIVQLDRAAFERLRPLACEWARAVATLSPAELLARRRRDGDEFDERAGVDGALVGVLGCDDPMDLVRVRHALGAPDWAMPLLRASEARSPAAATFEATLPPRDAALLAALRTAAGDVRRLEASRGVELARLVGELTGTRCTHGAPSLEETDTDDGSSPPAGRGFSSIDCAERFIPDFGVVYGLASPYCDNVIFPRVVFLVHGASGRFRVVSELVQQEQDSWSGFQSGEKVVGISSSRGAATFEIEIGSNGTAHHRELLVCSPRTAVCRAVQISTGDGPRDYTLTDTTLRVGATTVTLRAWLAGTGPTFGSAERPHDFPVPFRWARFEPSGTRDTELDRCSFVVRDADGTLNVRSEPDQRSRVVGTVASGSVIRAVWTARSWLRIEQPVAGWIFRGATERRCVP